MLFIINTYVRDVKMKISFMSIIKMHFFFFINYVIYLY